MPDDLVELKRQLLAERELTAMQAARLMYLEEQFRLAQQQRFGASSEGHPGQGELFNEAEEIVEVAQDESEQQDISYTRNRPKRKPLPKHLPREMIVHDIAQEDKTCDCCRGELHKIGEDTSEKLEFIPAQVKQAPAPPSVIPKGYATPSLLSQIITSKYQYGLPLYRQEAMFKQYGIELSRKTSADWMMKSADILQILYDKLRQHLLKQTVIYADETTIKVVGDNKSKSYMWLYATGADSPEGKLTGTDVPHIVLFDYHASRAGQCAVDYLNGYQGYLQVDGYAGYHKTQATLVGCWAHARRKFTDAKTAMGKHKSGKVEWALNHIHKLYRIEIQIKNKNSG